MLIGKRISGRYKILEVIGGGGMANVYLAKDMILEREVAMKVLRFDFSNDDEFIKRFRREAQSATSLAHPNIVSIYDVGEEDGIYYIVMEYVDGQTLKQYIQQFAPIHPRKAVNIMVQIVSAIQHAHDNQIIHRDIKPHNILIDHHGNVKVTDFGIAMAMSSTTITQTNSVLGSVHYLSPEQARGGLANKKSDIYSLGIVFFELLTGRLPFDGESAISIALKHLQSDTPSPRRWNPDIPQSIENIILKATAKDPFHRYDSSEEMEQDIESSFDPKRISEPKFEVPEDEEATKAIPLITNETIEKNKIEDTIVRTSSDSVVQSEIDDKKSGKKQKPKKRKSKLAIVIMTIFIILMLGTIAAFTIVPTLLLPKDIEVPDVTGKSYEEAISILYESGFEVGDPILQADGEVKEGYVIKTEPEANVITKEGTEIIVYESTGKERMTLEDYVGRDIDRVKSLLELKGFTNIKVIEETHDTELAGKILAQNPEVGEDVIPDEDTIELTVSKGPKLIKVDDLKNKSKSEINDYIQTYGFNSSISEEYSEEIPKDQLISQSPESGEEVVAKNTTLKLVYSLGPKEKPAKEVSKTITIPYEPKEEGQELVVSISIDDANNTISEVYDTFKITEPVEKTLTFTINPNEEAFYQVIIDNLYVTSEKISYPDE
ncbi:Stk1 family PASTA domain-containing Ser/Thr kinase [Bacillus weihaiensis]|uniref:Serine/threonine-protein kinase PrkC n=1 Tax=Bacillus weihaiensis TaxID=1547283 RepID=A0A1L3MSN2_9BACI|nr:Stk1 family PASTA domain-containing Ser/Thr kinase [Bacillus weihaiensis]APH05300.1 serine/threonine protein kinase [Bacillus weihaiensis]